MTWSRQVSRGGGARAGGRGVRLLIAVAIVAFGLIRHYSRTEVNPVTGETQRIALSTQQEIALGLRAAPQMAAQMGGEVPETDPAAALVEDLGRRLVSHSNAARSPYQFDFHLLADDRTINAFALPGGQVFITRALFDRLENEAQLAGVLGHEIGHVVHRHGAEHMATGELMQVLSTAVGVGASDDRNSGQMARAAAQMAAQMFSLKYGRSDELESDAYGLAAMSETGLDPSQMLGVMKVLAESSTGRTSEFLSSHPHPESRVQKIQEYLAAQHPHGAPASLSSGRALPGSRRRG